MGRRKKQEAKLDLEEIEGSGVLTQLQPEAADASSSDDEEANEDLSLKIVEKALLMRAAKLAPGPLGGVVSDSDDTDVSVGTVTKVIDLDNGVAIKKEKKKKKKKSDKLIVNKVENEELVMTALEDEEKEDPIGATDAVKSVDPNPVEIADNIILRKLLRGPRYFDPEGNNWRTCYNCGEEGHAAANCSQKRKRPCFVCGSLEHRSRHCSKVSCFSCKGDGHRAKDCPEKKKRGLQTEKICLKCGKSGHNMSLCGNDYSPEDLKEIQCYICKSFGHLCCLDSVDTDRSEISCYKCGQQGHNGLACARTRGGNQGEATPSSCYRCRERGHFARECKVSYQLSTSSREVTQGEAMPRSCYKCGQEGHFGRECYSTTKEHLRTNLHNGTQGEATPSSCYRCGEGGHFVRDCTFSPQLRKRNREPSTPGLRFYNEDRDTPDNSKKSSKRKKKDTDGSATKARNAKQRGGWDLWVSKNPRASKDKRPVKNNGWVSPATPSNVHRRFFDSQSPRKPQTYQNGDAYESRFSGSRFGNSRGDLTRRNYDWW